MPNVSGGGGAGLALASVTLTDAQVKLLTGGVVILAATETPNYTGVPKTIPVPVHAAAVVHSTAGAYTNVDATAALLWYYGSAGDEPVTATTASANNALAAADITPVVLDWTSGQLPALNGNLGDNALMLLLSNGGLGNVTGGNAANSLIVTVAYYRAALK